MPIVIASLYMLPYKRLLDVSQLLVPGQALMMPNLVTCILLLITNFFSQEISTATAQTTTKETTIPIPAKITFPTDILYEPGLLTRLGSKERVEDWIKKLFDAVQIFFDFSDESDNIGLDTKITFKIVHMEPYNEDVHCGQYQKVPCSIHHVNGVYMNPYNRSTGLLYGGLEDSTGSTHGGGFKCTTCTKGIMYSIGVGSVNNETADTAVSQLFGVLAMHIGHNFGMDHNGQAKGWSSDNNERYKQCYRKSWGWHSCMDDRET